MLSDSEQTQELLGRVADGDRPAFDQLFELHRDYLKGVVRVHLDPNSRFDASDVVQETHLHAHKHFEQYLQRRPMPFKLWLRKTAQQRLANLLRLHAADKRNMGRQQSLPDHSSILIAQNRRAEPPASDTDCQPSCSNCTRCCCWS